MKINPQIRETLNEVSKSALEQTNTKQSVDYKHMRRILKVFKTHLTEEEQLYIFKTTMELIHYRNVMVDPDNLLVLSNIKLRTYMFIFMLSTLTLVIAAVLFKTNSTLNGLIEFIARLVKIFSL